MSPSIATDQVRVWGGIRIIAILPGPGKVVLSTFHHASSDLIDLYLSPQPPTGVNSASSTHLTSTSSSPTAPLTTLQTSEEALLYPRASRATSIDPSWERIGVTGNHPIWSEDRHDYIAAMDLRIGERLKNLSGDTVYVQQKLPRPGPTPVYNLEVQDEHVYYVGASGVLAHNVGDECKSNVGVLVDGGNVVRKVRFGKGLRHAMKKHISGNGPLSLKTLDPGGNIDKWVAHLAQTASSGIGTIRPIPNGATLEIIAPMLRESGGTLNVGVRLFRQTGDDFWRLSTLLTEQ